MHSTRNFFFFSVNKKLLTNTRRETEDNNKPEIPKVQLLFFDNSQEWFKTDRDGRHIQLLNYCY